MHEDTTSFDVLGSQKGENGHEEGIFSSQQPIFDLPPYGVAHYITVAD